VYLSSGLRRDKLGLGSGGDGQQRGGGKAEPKAGARTKSRKAMGKG
jgi:hypothetical protein